MSKEEQLPPVYRKLEEALRSIGYSFENAIADIIDNSVDEDAENILVRLICGKDGRIGLAIWDDGNGMDPATLREAMRFGADVSQDIKRLGKFGLGLKLASLSQARDVRVISAKDGTVSGRAWLETGIAKEFTSTIFDARESARLIDEVAPDRKFEPSGTVVWWSKLYRVGHQIDSTQEHAQKLLWRLEKFLPITFHRFLSGRPRRVFITLDIYDQVSRLAVGKNARQRRHIRY